MGATGDLLRGMPKDGEPKRLGSSKRIWFCCMYMGRIFIPGPSSPDEPSGRPGAGVVIGVATTLVGRLTPVKGFARGLGANSGGSRSARTSRVRVCHV